MSSESDAIDKMFAESPLIGFSVYTHLQSQFLTKKGTDIVQSLDSALATNAIDGQVFNSIYGEFWLWTLGSYEVLRTMAQNRACFSDRVADATNSLKQRLSRLRVPFAKQELPGGRRSNRKPIQTEASVYGVDTDNRDITFEVGGEIFSVRQLVSEFHELIGNIRREDILKDHRSGYVENAS